MKRERPTGPAGIRRERQLHRLGYSLIAGVDEAGRGSWAGPLVAAAAILPPLRTGLPRALRGLADSKQLTVLERERLYAAIQALQLPTGLGIVGPEVLDLIGLSAAGRLAMERAVRGLPTEPDYLLVDAYPLPNVRLPQEAIVFGDSICASIAAASIVAKVERDRLMDRLAEEHPGYGFERNKGYGTTDHRRALRELGPSAIHRRSYRPLLAFAPGA